MVMMNAYSLRIALFFIMRYCNGVYLCAVEVLFLCLQLTSGNMRTTCSTRTCVQTLSRRSGTSQTGKTSRTDLPKPRAANCLSVDLRIHVIT